MRVILIWNQLSEDDSPDWNESFKEKIPRESETKERSC